MQEEVLSAAVSVTTKATDLTMELILKIFNFMMTNRAEGEKLKTGQQSLKELNKHGTELGTETYSNADTKFIKRELKKYGIDFSVTKNKEEETCTLFFKGKDVSQILAATDKLARKLDKEKDKSIEKKCEKAQNQRADKKLDPLAKETKRKESPDENKEQNTYIHNNNDVPNSILLNETNGRRISNNARDCCGKSKCCGKSCAEI